MTATDYASVLGLLGVALGVVVVLAARARRGAPAAAAVGALGGLMALWCSLYVLRLSVHEPDTVHLLDRLCTAVRLGLPPTVLLAALAFTGRGIRRRTAVALYAGCQVIAVAGWANDAWHVVPDAVVVATFLGTDLLLVLTVGVVLSAWGTLPRDRRGGVPLLLLALGIPWALSWAHFLTGFGGVIDPVPPSTALSAALVAYVVLRLRFLDIFRGLIPVGREQTLQMMEDGILVVDRRGEIIDVNPAASVLAGIPLQELLGRRAAEALGHWPSEVLEADDVSATVTDEFPGPLHRSLEFRVRPLSASGGTVSGRIIVVRDVTERRLWEARLARQALHDPLTGLANRVQVRRALDEALSTPAARPVALLLLDLDHFKDVNDTLGHPAGDRLLVETGLRLERRLEPGQTLGRLGGDEFAVVAPRCDRARAGLLAGRLLAALDDEFRVDVEPFAVGASIGIAEACDGVRDPDELLRRADIALYAAKRVRRSVAFWEAGQQREAVSRLGLRERLMRAIAEEQLELHYQPQYRFSDRRVVCVEALVRWRHPERGLLRPSVFVTAAEEVGAIGALTDWVTRRALADCAAWNRDGHPVRVAVNLSPHMLDDPGMVDSIAAAARAQGADPAFLTVELTESAVVRDLGQGGRALQRLREHGVGVSIDDFGVGYSSLAHLGGLPVSELKVDRHFVQRLHRTAADRIIVGSVVSLGHQLGFPVVAEGVEDPEQLAAVRTVGCDIVQGHHVCPPLPRERLVEWLRQGAPLGVVTTAHGAGVPYPAPVAVEGAS